MYELKRIRKFVDGSQGGTGLDGAMLSAVRYMFTKVRKHSALSVASSNSWQHIADMPADQDRPADAGTCVKLDAYDR